DFGNPLLQESESEIVRRDPRVEEVARTRALGCLDVTVCNDNTIPFRRIDHAVLYKRKIRDTHDLVSLSQVNGRVISGTAARADKPFALTAQINESRAGQFQVVQRD